MKKKLKKESDFNQLKSHGEIQINSDRLIYKKNIEYFSFLFICAVLIFWISLISIVIFGYHGVIHVMFYMLFSIILVWYLSFYYIRRLFFYDNFLIINHPTRHLFFKNPTIIVNYEDVDIIKFCRTGATGAQTHLKLTYSSNSEGTKTIKFSINDVKYTKAILKRLRHLGVNVKIETYKIDDYKLLE